MKRFLQQNMLILILMNSGNLFNYLFQMFLGRSLGPADFGEFNALNSTLAMFAAPLAIVPLVMAKFTARYSLEDMGRVKTLLIKGLKWISLAAVLAYLAGCALIPVLKAFLHIEATSSFLIMFAVMAASFVLPAPWGMLQGLQRFLGYGIAGASNAFFRFAALFLWVVLLGLGVNGALLAGLTGVLAALILNLVFLKDVFRIPGAPLPGGVARELGVYSSGILISSVLIMALWNLDMMLVRHYCSAEGAGLYATGAILGRIAFYLPSVLISVLFTEAAKAKESGEDGRKSMWLSMGITALLGGGFAGFCALFSEFVAGALFGAEFAKAGPLMAVISAAMALLAVSNVLFAYFQARSEFGFVWIQAAGVALFIGLTAAHHETPMTIAVLLLASIAAIFIATLAWFLWRSKRPAPSIADADARP